MVAPLLLLLAAAGGEPAVAAAETLPDVTVTGRALAQPPGAAAYDTELIDRDRLQASASGRLEDGLRDIAGFQQFRRSNSTAANPTSQGVTLRGIGGSAASRALVLLDGAPVADPFAGYVPFPALSPERLAYARVTRGGGTGAFGAGAVSGVIELESTGAADAQPAYLRALGGERGSVDTAAGIAVRPDGALVTLDGRYDRGDGYVLVPGDQRGPVDIPARYESWSAALRGVIPAGEQRELQTRVLLFDDRRLRGIEGTRSSSSGVDASLRLVSRGPWAVDLIGYAQLRNFRSGFVSVSDHRSSAALTLDQFKTPAVGAGGKLEVRPPVGAGHTLRIGIDGRYAAGRVNELFRFVAGEPTRVRRAGGLETTLGAFVEEDWTSGPLTLTGGVRVDRWTITGGSLVEREIAGADTQLLTFPDRSGVEPSGRIGARYRLNPALGVRAAGYSGWRQPTLSELYRPFRVGSDATAANALLKNERLYGGEAGLDYRPLPGWRLSATGYYNRLQNAVVSITAGEGPGLFPQVGAVAAGGVFRLRSNIDAIEAIGLELSAAARRGPIELKASYAFADSHVEARGDAAQLNGLRPAQTPQHQLSATAAARLTCAELSLTLRYVDNQFEDDLNSRRLPAATTLDGYAAVALRPGVRLIARAENLWDERVVSGVSGSGVLDLGSPRTLWLGVSLGR
ncbi:MAG: TonB-dependent receptor [Sphingomonadaceae bacterium]|nr:TonB-dependent receptor [Sphingomonadaceae bacterium]